MSRLRVAGLTGQVRRELHEIVHLCEIATVADRELDARIALAIFPRLAVLEKIGVGVWRHSDGSRIRALRYSADETAAASLLPAGHWLEADPDALDRVWVYGPCSGDEVSARHVSKALAIAAACMHMRAKLKAKHFAAEAGALRSA
ncbi:MAG: hypothetical protein KGJ57_17800 [Sphingomonadales bacterium]|nr:hypothetical protein [Sphingomonadales bacterium]MDE2171253.1 hypothetical protein [Sphingomonadales bacterium]